MSRIHWNRLEKNKIVSSLIFFHFLTKFSKFIFDQKLKQILNRWLNFSVMHGQTAKIPLGVCFPNHLLQKESQWSPVGQKLADWWLELQRGGSCKNGILFGPIKIGLARPRDHIRPSTFFSLKATRMVMFLVRYKGLPKIEGSGSKWAPIGNFRAKWA